MTRSNDGALDNLVVQLAVDDVIALSDDEMEQDSPIKIDPELEAGEDSEGFDYGDEDDFDYVYDDTEDSPAAAALPPSGEVDDHQLASFRRGWHAEVEVAHQPPLAPPSLLKVFETPPLLRRILSEPLLGRADLRSAALVTSAFLTPARSLLFHRVDLDTPLRALRLLKVLEMSPQLAQHIDTLSIGLGDLDAVLREVPFIQARMSARRQEEDNQPNEWFWAGGGEMGRQGGGREGKQAWEEDIRLKLGKQASAVEVEEVRRQGWFQAATTVDGLSEEEQDELRTHLQRTFSSWPFDGVVDTSPSHRADSDPLSTTSMTPPSHALPAPKLSPTFARSLLGVLSAVPNLTFADPAIYSTSSALLPALSLSSTAKTLITNPSRDDNPMARSLGVALEQPLCRLSLRTDGLGLADAPGSIRSLNLRACTLVGARIEERASMEERVSTQAASCRSLQELEMEQVGWEQGENRRRSTSSSSLLNAAAPPQPVQDAPYTSADLLRFVGASPQALTSLNFSRVDGFSWPSINATILASSSTLVTLKLNSVNGGSTSPTPSRSYQTTSGAPGDVDVDLAAEEEEITFTNEQIRDFSPFGPHYDARHQVLSAEKMARRSDTPAGQRAYERSEEQRLLSFKLWERWVGPNAIPVEQVREEQQQASLAFHRSLPSVDRVGSAASSSFDPSIFDHPPTAEPSLLYALSRCSSLRHLRLVDWDSSNDSLFAPHLVEALLRARTPLEELDWSVKMEARSREEWVEWEKKVRQIMPQADDNMSEKVQVYVSVNLHREGVDFVRKAAPGMKAVRATRAS